MILMLHLLANNYVVTRFEEDRVSLETKFYIICHVGASGNVYRNAGSTRERRQKGCMYGLIPGCFNHENKLCRYCLVTVRR